MSVIFEKYRADSISAAQKSNEYTKEMANMRYLGQCTLELGPHLFAETSFYEAVRKRVLGCDCQGCRR